MAGRPWIPVVAFFGTHPPPRIRPTYCPIWPKEWVCSSTPFHHTERQSGASCYPAQSAASRKVQPWDVRAPAKPQEGARNRRNLAKYGDIRTLAPVIRTQRLGHLTSRQACGLFPAGDKKFRNRGAAFPVQQRSVVRNGPETGSKLKRWVRDSERSDDAVRPRLRSGKGFARSGAARRSAPWTRATTRRGWPRRAVRAGQSKPPSRHPAK